MQVLETKKKDCLRSGGGAAMVTATLVHSKVTVVIFVYAHEKQTMKIIHLSNSVTSKQANLFMTGLECVL